MLGQIVPDAAIRPADPDFTCAAIDCYRDGTEGILGGIPYCQPHLAEIMATEELTARIDSDLIVRLADFEDESPVKEVLAWAKATGRAVEVCVTVRVAKEATKRGCEGSGPRHGGSPRDVMLAGRQRFLCDWCEQDARAYDAQVTRTGAA